MKNRFAKPVGVLPAIALTLFAFVPAAIPQSSTPKPKATAGDTKDAVHQITLPQVSTAIPEGPNIDIYRRDCLLCHSARYVTMQPHFSRIVWQNEVKKMITAYGATIPDADRDKIVDYLMAVRGVEEQSPAPPK